MDAWIDAWMDGCMDRCMDRCMDGWMEMAVRCPVLGARMTGIATIRRSHSHTNGWAFPSFFSLSLSLSLACFGLVVPWLASSSFRHEKRRKKRKKRIPGTRQTLNGGMMMMMMMMYWLAIMPRMRKATENRSAGRGTSCKSTTLRNCTSRLRRCRSLTSP